MSVKYEIIYFEFLYYSHPHLFMNYNILIINKEEVTCLRDARHLFIKIIKYELLPY